MGEKPCTRKRTISARCSRSLLAMPSKSQIVQRPLLVVSWTISATNSKKEQAHFKIGQD